MERTSLQALLAVLATGIAAVLLSQGGGGAGTAPAQAADADPIEGVWESTVTVRDCASGSVLRTFRGFHTFHRGGVLSDTHGATPGARGQSLGTWQRGATPGAYAASSRFERFDAAGAPAGTQHLTRTIRLAPDRNRISATLSLQVQDAGGRVRHTDCGTETSIRLS